MGIIVQCRELGLGGTVLAQIAKSGRGSRRQDAADWSGGLGRHRNFAALPTSVTPASTAPGVGRVVIAAAIGLIEGSDLRRIYCIQRREFWLSMTCFAGVAVFGAIPGMAIAAVIAVIEFPWDGWRPHSAVLGRVARVKGYHDINRHPDARLIPGLVLFRWDAPLFFASLIFFATCGGVIPEWHERRASR